MAPTLETGSLRDAELDIIRRQNDYEMEDKCRVFRVESEGELQPDGTMSDSVEVDIYIGICSITPIIARRDRFDEFGQGLVYSVQYRLTLPYTATGISITDRVTMTATKDPDFTDREFEVRDVHRTTDISQRRVTVHDLQR